MVVKSESTYKNIITEFTQNTAMHGVSNITRADGRSNFRKAIWTLLTLAGAATLIYYVQYIVTSYMKKEVEVNVRMLFDPAIAFPAITICNVNPVIRQMVGKYSKTPAGQNAYVQALDDIIGYIRDISGKPPGPPPDKPPSIGSPPAKRRKRHDKVEEEAAYPIEFVSQHKALENDRTKRQGPGPPQNSLPDMSGINFWTNQTAAGSQRYDNLLYEQFLSTMQLMYVTDPNIAYNVSTKFDSTFFDCSWKGMMCPDLWRDVWNYKYGTCFTFNPLMVKQEVLRTSRPGTLHGFSASLFLNTPSYVMEVTPNMGFKVVIHPPHQMPFPEDTGYDISPGFETNIGVKLVHVSRLEAPYVDKCVPSDNVDFVNDFRVEATADYPYFVNYSKQACLKSCTQREIIKACSCGTFEYPMTHQLYKLMSNSSASKFCDPGVKVTSACVKKTETRIEKGDITCNCPPVCEEETYESSLSRSQWPTPSVLDNLIKLLSRKSTEFATLFNDPDQQQVEKRKQELMRNLVRVNVFFEDLNYEHVVQKPAYTNDRLISDLGGQAGLWMGLSIIACFELFELLVDLFWYCTGRDKYARKQMEKAELENSEK